MESKEEIKTKKLSKNNEVLDNEFNHLKRTFKKEDFNKKSKKKNKKICMSLSKLEELELDNTIEKNDKISILAIVLVLIVCFCSGIFLGILLYNIAINGNL